MFIVIVNDISAKHSLMIKQFRRYKHNSKQHSPVGGGGATFRYSAPPLLILKFNIPNEPIILSILLYVCSDPDALNAMRGGFGQVWVITAP
jgi:hypothetical protein